MAGNPNYDNIRSTTIDNYLSGVGDSYTAHSRALVEFKKAGRIAEADGGTSLTEGVEYDGNGSAGWVVGTERIALTNKAFLTRAAYPWKKAYSSIVIIGDDEAENSGSSKMEDLLFEKTESAIRSLGNLLGAAFYSDGTDPKQMGGLQYLVSDTPAAGVVGGIDPSQASNTFWRNYASSAALTSANIITAFDNAITKTTRNTDRVNLAFTDNSSRAKYYAGLQAQQRFSTSTADGGFTDLMVNGLKLINDQAMNGFCPAGHTYFLNTNMLKFRPHKKYNPKRQGGVQSIDQDASVNTLWWRGNMTMKGREFQGVVIDTAPTVI